MKTSTTMRERVERYIALRRDLGYQFAQSGDLRRFAQFADETASALRPSEGRCMPEGLSECCRSWAEGRPWEEELRPQQARLQSLVAYRYAVGFGGAQQPHHHPRIVRRLPTLLQLIPAVDRAQIQFLHHLPHEVHQVVRGQPLVQPRRQQEHLLRLITAESFPTSCLL
jgi:hypothetical protein